MPNGWSGGFIIETDILKNLLTAVSHAAVIGKLTTGVRPRTASAAEISRYVEECPLNRVAVEEQDHTSYVIHISDEPDIIWVSVDSESPLFDQLRQRHARWRAEHTG